MTFEKALDILKNGGEVSRTHDKEGVFGRSGDYHYKIIDNRLCGVEGDKTYHIHTLNADVILKNDWFVMS